MAPPAPASARTLIFLDVDGILNVVARDYPGSVLLTEESIAAARSVLKLNEDWRLLRTARRVMALSKEREEPLPPFVADRTGVSDVLLNRFVELLRHAEPAPEVLLSSQWRRPEKWEKSEALRAAIEEKLGRPFRWAGTTPWRQENSAAERLQSIGAKVRELALSTGSKVLVLDDFSITPFAGWHCGGRRMRNKADAERYLAACCFAEGVSVKVVHPFQDLSTDDDLQVQASVGLTLQHFAEAADFLTSVAAEPGQARPPTPASTWKLLRADNGTFGQLRDLLFAKSKKQPPTKLSI